MMNCTEIDVVLNAMKLRVSKMDRYMLRLLPDGDIDIIKESNVLGVYEVVYHKSYNLGESIKKNLDEAYKEWEELNEESYKEMLSNG